MSSVTVSTKVARKQPDLPRFAVVPARFLTEWHLSGTTVVDVLVNGAPVSRRTLKPWTEAAWFITITQADCDALGIETGSPITLELSLADERLPSELEELLASSTAARSAWQLLTAAQQRMLREHIAGAKKPETRARRAKQALVSGS